MSNYELASLYAQTGQTVNMQMANWLATLSVYLGAGYLVSHRLKLSMAIVLSLFAAMLLGSFAGVIATQLEVVTGVSAEMQKIAQSGGGLEWHPAVRVSASWIKWFPLVSKIMMWMGILMAVYFFFSMRREHLRAAAAQGEMLEPVAKLESE